MCALLIVELYYVSPLREASVAKSLDRWTCRFKTGIEWSIKDYFYSFCVPVFLMDHKTKAQSQLSITVPVHFLRHFPFFSFSHLRNVRHYAVYETEKDGQMWYYIFPKGPRKPSLRELVTHCQEHGLSEHTKMFRTPDGNAKGVSGRFLHVRLRHPVPVRTRTNTQ